jgi:antitoxin MazE
MRTKIQKWGNSAAVRLPAATLASAGVSIGRLTDIRVEAGCIVIVPVPETQFSLDGLLAGLDPKAFPDETDFGTPQGGEIW